MGDDTYKSVVLLSGGMDSAVCLGIAAKRNDEVIPVHFNYGQQTATYEAQMARRQMRNIRDKFPDRYIHPITVIGYQPVFSVFADGVADPEKEFGHLTEEDGRSSGYVPMRNLHFIATGAAVADTRNAAAVYHGAQGGDHADYPDCRPDFMDRAEGAINQSIPEGQEIALRTPLLHSSKPEVIHMGEELGIDWSATYSCYTAIDDPRNPTPCGDCPACIERAEAFEAAEVEDPYSTNKQVRL